MEKTKHFFANSIYLLSNHSVAGNPMFTDIKLQEYFSEKMEFYLSPFAQILAYDISDNGFQILLKLGDRPTFEHYFDHKPKLQKELAIDGIPDTTYLVSQAMANLQVSFVKHFNYVHNRSGTLMAGRFRRKLVESEEEVRGIIERLNQNKKSHFYSKKWRHKMAKSNIKFNSMWMYGGARENSRKNEIYKSADHLNLGVIFENLPPKRLKSTKLYFKRKYNLLFGPITT